MSFPSTLLSQLSSPPPSTSASSPNIVESESKYGGVDEEVLALNQSFLQSLSNGTQILSTPTQVVHIPIHCRPASTLTECFQCHDFGHYQEDYPLYVCPHCHQSAPGHPLSSYLTIQCNFWN